MHVRVSSVKRRGKVYRYAQLVESYRRPTDGMPAHRVLASLGELSSSAIDNLRLALKATRVGKAVVLPSDTVTAVKPQPVQANRRYLDIAVAMELWKQWGLDSLLAKLLGKSKAEISSAAVIASLVIQRCVAPGSKLYAERWFPTTALAELLAISPRRFNNSRIHRSLALLEECEDDLQKGLTEKYQAERGSFATLFLDVTDTWFEGQGPDLAQKNRTKEGLVKRRVGIVLLCNQLGYPVRWKVVHGRAYDAHAMTTVIRSIQQETWTHQAPLVCDRIMGRAGVVEELLDSGVWFITATTRPEFDSYTDRIPSQATVDLELECTDASRPDDIRKAAKAVLDAGMTREADDLFFLDLGVIEKGRSGSANQTGTGMRMEDLENLPRAVAALTLAREVRRELDAEPALTYQEVAGKHGYSKNHIYTVLRLLRLPADVLEAIEHGRGQDLGLYQLRDLAKLKDPQKIREAYDRLVSKQSRRGSTGRLPARDTGKGRAPKKNSHGPCLRVRGTVYFNPEIFVAQARHLEERVEELYTFVRDLNTRLRSPTCRRRESSLLAEVGKKLEKIELRDSFDVAVTSAREGERDCFEVKLTRNQAAWKRRRKYLGFVLIIAHPDLSHSAAELCRLYREKDTVEKDFQVIKSVLELRPVRHRTDPKVRAHVSLCMLALLLERTLEHRLAQTSHKQSARSVFELLSTCHLNELLPDGHQQPLYSVTRCTEEQLALLRQLGMEGLVDDDDVANSLTVR